MSLTRRQFLVTAPAVAVTANTAWGQTHFPGKPIRIIAPFAPGSSDMIARRLGESVSGTLGQPVVVENRPGAQGVVASRALAKAASDGYTLLLGTNSTHAASIYLFREPGYDPIKDFTPIMRFTTNPLVLCVRTDSKIDSLKAFIDYGKAHSGQLNYGAGNTGSLVATHLLTTQAGFDAQAVNYAGNAIAVNDFLAGRLDFMVTDPMIIKQFVQAGQVRMLGLTSRQKLPLFPHLAPIADQGLPDYEYASWIGLFGPARLPDAVTQTLYTAFSKAMASEPAQQYLNSIGMIAADLPPVAFADYVKDQIQVWGRLTKAAGLVAQ
ncbi:hypothetical protein W822_15915 [Advenella kashmirensis W13003]|uniref:ABC transporter substrate-binding protein n=1 Tax=Advenella kashmirensis W13003 TaxID=1424334 RepID=V8QR26_9BURK|nr:tripartite tricarboxylate transporter substrate binding protein [Advenella kashmirensis]ETF02431.1 hypothetical protein W822_15915 [Advenella kashmirensis W13003]